jgi:DNA-directed RNA polymerase II subunit RPB1
MDGNQRSEDDISHTIVNIIKANKTLLEKMNEPSVNSAIIDDWQSLLQYFIATQVDNNIPSCAPVAQRSGRPLKSIKERLNGKQGRVRGNLMGKRVDFSARSVITPDPNLSIRELGVPKKIAMNITKPVIVNNRNRDFLQQLVSNGPDVYPGANILEKKTGGDISLRYMDRSTVVLENGDVVHRHMMDGDGVLFNRQPTLHRMSMMCHIARIMQQGDTFRMNIGDTKPYNADFDGDEMNLHMPQDDEAEAELKGLAAVPYQIISPAKNNSIIGIFQDSLLGIYQFTRSGIGAFDARSAMNLLMGYKNVDASLFSDPTKKITNFEILSQILPPLSMKYKTKQFGGSDDYATSNNVLEIRDGEILRGHIDSGVLASSTNGMIQRICNDFGNMASANFIDDLQNIITEYMKTSAYSVGISDLISDKKTTEKIIDSIKTKKLEVKTIIDNIHIGTFENKSGRTNEEEFELLVTNILNKANGEAGDIGLKSLSKTNRFITMVNAGSKGSKVNIAQMICLVGQQTIDGKRVPYGFDSRTLPHYSKYDDGPAARGFVENSFIAGLTPSEVFFHAMGGRVGLIDTAVKTSQTGYIQRRLIKGMEDIKVEYDMTVRNSKNRIVQFSYGEDGIDTVKIEHSNMNFIGMTPDEIYAHFYVPVGGDSETTSELKAVFSKTAFSRMKKQQKLCDEKSKKYTDYLMNVREDIVVKVFKNKNTTDAYLPLSFSHIVANIGGMQKINKNSEVDITPLETFILLEETYARFELLQYAPPTELFKIMYYYSLTPRDLLMVKRFNRKAVVALAEMMVLMYKRAIVAPGEMVGMIAAQSIGEPTTQLTLNTFHLAGHSSKSQVTRGLPRIEELLSLSENTKNPSTTIYLKPSDESNKDAAADLIPTIELTRLEDIVKSVEICFDPSDSPSETKIAADSGFLAQYAEFQKMLKDVGGEDETECERERSKWILRMEMDRESMYEKRVTMDDVHFAIKAVYSKNDKSEVSCIYSDYNSDNLVFRIRLDFQKKDKEPKTLDQTDKIYQLKTFQDALMKNIILRGIKGIRNVLARKVVDMVAKENNTFRKKETWVLDATGSNFMEILSLKNIDTDRTISNDVQEINRVLGIEAARQALFNELYEAFDTTYINQHHISLLCDRMTSSSNLISIFRHGINNDDIGPIAKASFEETPEMFLKAARHAELDHVRGISANVMCGQEGFYGTNAFKVMLDITQIMKMGQVATADKTVEEEKEAVIQGFMDKIAAEDPLNPCSKNKLTIQSTLDKIQGSNLGSVDPDYDMGF